MSHWVDDDTDALLDALAARRGLAVRGLAALGLGDGPHPVAFFSLAALEPDDVDRLLGDHVGDDLLEVVPDAFDRDAHGRRRWRRGTLEPIALVGTAETFELGPALADALPAAAILLLDRAATPPAVLGWNRSPVHHLVPLGPALADLDVVDRG